MLFTIILLCSLYYLVCLHITLRNGKRMLGITKLKWYFVIPAIFITPIHAPILLLILGWKIVHQ